MPWRPFEAHFGKNFIHLLITLKQTGSTGSLFIFIWFLQCTLLKTRTIFVSGCQTASNIFGTDIHVLFTWQQEYWCKTPINYWDPPKFRIITRLLKIPSCWFRTISFPVCLLSSTFITENQVQHKLSNMVSVHNRKKNSDQTRTQQIVARREKLMLKCLNQHSFSLHIVYIELLYCVINFELVWTWNKVAVVENAKKCRLYPTFPYQFPERRRNYNNVWFRALMLSDYLYSSLFFERCNHILLCDWVLGRCCIFSFEVVCMPQNFRTLPGQGWTQCPTVDVVLYQVLRVSEQQC